jgi:hypothetical protein
MSDLTPQLTPQLHDERLNLYPVLRANVAP